MPEPSFLVDASGPFTREQLRIAWYEEPRGPHAMLDALVDRTWKAELEAARRDGRVLFNGQLVRLLRHRVRGGALELDVGPTDYREFMGTNYLNWRRLPEFGYEFFSNPIGTSAVLVTCDGWLVLGRRNDRVACHPGYIHSFGGGLEAGEKGPDGTFDAFAATARELKEELRIEAGDIAWMSCLGLIRDAAIRQPELIFDARLRLSRADLNGRLRVDDPDEEHIEILACMDEPCALVSFVRDSRKMAPVALGAILLHGRISFGEDWYRQTDAELNF
jgi:8-oxo-dGTP pyrophosphatase MutT (NUDIX family)